MIYDADAWIGHWPFRALPGRTATDLLKQMDKNGIEKALVGSLNGLFYKDVHEANRELVQDIRRHRDRLFPCAVLDPNYYGWRDDLKQCREEFGMRVLRFTPGYHQYVPGDKASAEMVQAALDLKMIPSLIGRMVDSRGRHWNDPGRQLRPGDAVSLLNQFPKATFLMLNFYNPLEKRRWDNPRCFYDTAYMVGGNGGRMKEIIETLGTDRVVFGTTALMRYPSPSRINLDLCDLKRLDLERILWRNLAALVPEMK